MNATFRLFQLWMTAKRHPSAAQACAALGVSRTAATHWKNGHSAEAALIERMCSEIGEESLKWLAAVEADKAEKAGREPDAKVWLRRATELGWAAALFLAITLGGKSANAATVAIKDLYTFDNNCQVYTFTLKNN